MPVLVLSAAALPAHRDEASVQLLRSWPTAQHARVHAAQDAPHRCSRPHFPISSCWAACCYTASIVMVAAQPATAWWASSVVGGAAGVGFDSLASVWAFLLLGFALGQVSILEAVESIHANERVRGDATGCVRAGKRRSSSLFVRGSIATEQATQAAAVRETLSLSPPPTTTPAPPTQLLPRFRVKSARVPAIFSKVALAWHVVIIARCAAGSVQLGAMAVVVHERAAGAESLPLSLLVAVMGHCSWVCGAHGSKPPMHACRGFLDSSSVCMSVRSCASGRNCVAPLRR